MFNGITLYINSTSIIYCFCHHLKMFNKFLHDTLHTLRYQATKLRNEKPKQHEHARQVDSSTPLSQTDQTPSCTKKRLTNDEKTKSN